jgi:hypothetical protein
MAAIPAVTRSEEARLALLCRSFSNKASEGDPEADDGARVPCD